MELGILNWRFLGGFLEKLRESVRIPEILKRFWSIIEKLLKNVENFRDSRTTLGIWRILERFRVNRSKFEWNLEEARKIKGNLEDWSDESYISEKIPNPTLLHALTPRLPTYEKKKLRKLHVFQFHFIFSFSSHWKHLFVFK